MGVSASHEPTSAVFVAVIVPLYAVVVIAFGIFGAKQQRKELP